MVEGHPMAELAASLTQTLFDITAIPSPIGEEKALCDHVEQRLGQRLGAARITRFHDSLVVRVNERASGTSGFQSRRITAEAFQ